MIIRGFFDSMLCDAIVSGFYGLYDVADIHPLVSIPIPMCPEKHDERVNCNRTVSLCRAIVNYMITKERAK